MAVDGSIIIDTRIDAKGINKGVASISKSLNGILGIVKNIGKFMVAAFIGGEILGFFRSIVQSFDIMGSSVADKLKPLSDALATLKGAFVNLLITALIPMIPYLVSIVQWLTNLIFTVTKVVAALFGMKTTIGGIAQTTKQAAKEARGALAAFDQINVLQTQDATTPENTPLFTPEAMEVTSEIQDFIENILEHIQTIKDILKTLFDNPLAVIGLIEAAWRAFVEWVRENLPFGDIIADVLEIIGNTFKKLVVNFLETFLEIKENILLVFKGIKEFLTGVFTGDWALAWQGLKDIASGILGAIGAWLEGLLNSFLILFGALIDTIKVVFAPILDWLAEKFIMIKNAIVGAWENLIEWLTEKFTAARDTIVTVWGALAEWFTTNVIDPIRETFQNALEFISNLFASIFGGIKDIVFGALGGVVETLNTLVDSIAQALREGFGTALEWIHDRFVDVFSGVENFVRGAINNIIDFVNGLIESVTGAINMIVAGFNMLGSIVPDFTPMEYIDAPQIPHLATGAVIPPNSQFLAVLGDQTSGRNIEAPEGLIRQIMREELGQITADIQIGFGGSLGALIRELKPHIDKENVRIGPSLIQGAK